MAQFKKTAIQNVTLIELRAGDDCAAGAAGASRNEHPAVIQQSCGVGGARRGHAAGSEEGSGHGIDEFDSGY